MSSLIAFPARGRKAEIKAASRLRVRAPADDFSPLHITIRGATAANIRRDALKFGKTPEQFLTVWLDAGFNFLERPA
jgi:hypothetical protein